ncbi:lipopolysaccharide kinase InaA family protein [Halopseudomonas salegens]|uniref:Lipopolysaccharide kinase (Kdo/WaaP) family protein n=1 Tax=Halopseudomonas salegens TaxID=1434072 RepID=A0A1H2EKY7_9GAMM|nr:lipopolysaccharide kinase InaA family protein [Halopseudomonas salegens]SDT95418.1 Lipopolysaccharide kinase (Kdo/WaaP) family protein [Halopseudomonas salegens]
MRLLDRKSFDNWLETAEVIEQDQYGIKVMRLDDGTFLKLFRRKTLLSKNTLFPHAKRFAGNAHKLHSMGIPCPTILDLYKMRRPYRSVVHYEPLPGDTLRQVLENATPSRQVEVMSQLGSFVSRLHDLGVYFRSLHMGNIILTPQGELGLIDISDMRCLGRPLSKWMRKRNYQHLLRYAEDWEQVQPVAHASFMMSLLQ